LKTKIYKISVYYEQSLELSVEDTNGNRAIETAREFVKDMFKDCRITAARLEEVDDNPKFYISKNFNYKENKNGK